MVDFDDRHAQLVVRELVKAKVTPFLGAGANLCGRPRDSSWEPGVPWFPSGAELSRHLAERFRYEGDTPDDLMAVATYGEAYQGESRSTMNCGMSSTGTFPRPRSIASSRGPRGSLERATRVLR